MCCWNVHGFVGFPKDFTGRKHFYKLETNEDKAHVVSGKTWWRRMQPVWTFLSPTRHFIGKPAWWLAVKNRMLMSLCAHRYEAGASRDATGWGHTQVLIPVSLNLAFTGCWYSPWNPGSVQLAAVPSLGNPHWWDIFPHHLCTLSSGNWKTRITEQLNNLKLG